MQDRMQEKKVYMGAAQCTQQHISYRQTPFAGSD